MADIHMKHHKLEKPQTELQATRAGWEQVAPLPLLHFECQTLLLPADREVQIDRSCLITVAHWWLDYMVLFYCGFSVASRQVWLLDRHCMSSAVLKLWVETWHSININSVPLLSWRQLLCGIRCHRFLMVYFPFHSANACATYLYYYKQFDWPVGKSPLHLSPFTEFHLKALLLEHCFAAGTASLFSSFIVQVAASVHSDWIAAFQVYCSCIEVVINSCNSNTLQ